MPQNNNFTAIARLLARPVRSEIKNAVAFLCEAEAIQNQIIIDEAQPLPFVGIGHTTTPNTPGHYVSVDLKEHLSRHYTKAPNVKDGLIAAILLGNYFYNLSHENTEGVEAADRLLIDLHQQKLPKQETIETLRKVLQEALQMQGGLEAQQKSKSQDAGTIEDAAVKRKILSVYATLIRFPGTGFSEHTKPEDLADESMRKVPTSAAQFCTREELMKHCPKWLPKKVFGKLIDDLDGVIVVENDINASTDVRRNNRVDFYERLEQAVMPYVTVNAKNMQKEAHELHKDASDHRLNRDILLAGIDTLNKIHRCISTDFGRAV